MEIWTKQVLLKIAVIVLINFRSGLTGETTWHMGCAIYNSTQTVEFMPIPVSPAGCCNSCLDQGYSYAGLQENQCVCFHELPGYLNVSQEQCTERCGSLPCGGNSSLSLYTTYGPYVRHVRLKSVSVNQIDADTLFEAKILLASDYFQPTGLESFNSTDLEKVGYTWYLNGSAISTGSKTVGNDSAVVAFLHKFDAEGLYAIDLVANNSVSQLNATTTTINIVLPYPAELQVSLSPGQQDIPSCIPLLDGLDPAIPAVSVFVDEPASFQASLVRGVNVTFSWQFGGESVQSEPQESCFGLECLQDNQVYTFVEKGIVTVSVNATNYLGTISKTLSVVVLDKRISNLTVNLAEHQSSHREVNTTVYYLITLDTAGRAVSTLSVDFGDGTSYSHTLQDVNDTFISGGAGNSAHLHLSASYGEGCRLFVSLDHKYRTEGVFQVSVEVFNNLTSETAVMEDRLVVQNPIATVGFSKEIAYETGESFNVSLLLSEEHAIGVTYHWWLLNSNRSVWRHQSEDSWQTFRIDAPGVYELNVTAANAVSQRSAQTVLTVEDAIEVLGISSDKHVTNPGDAVTFSVEILRGSNLSAIWDFGDDTRKSMQVDGSFGTQVAHEYSTEGVFNASLRLWNSVDEVTVYLDHKMIILDALEGMTIHSPCPTLFPSVTTLEISFTKGTDISFTVSSNGEILPASVQTLSTGGYLLELNVTTVGTQRVNVTASNAVSSINQEFLLLIQKDVGDVSIEVLRREQDIVLLARENGFFPDRSDLLYSWLDQQTGEVIQRGSPFLLLPDVKQLPKSFNLTVSNHVGSKWILANVDPDTSHHQVNVSHPLYAEVGSDVHFEAMVNGVAILNVRFGDGEVISQPIDEAHFSWSHAYSSPASYDINMSFIFQNGSSLNTTSVVSVQERILDLKINGPNVSVYSGPSTSQGWEVIPGEGTNIVYEWQVTLLRDHSVTREGRLAGDHTKLYLPFPDSGLYNVTVTASNDISSMTVSVTTLLQEPIRSLSVTCKPTVIGTNSEICVQVEGSTPLEIQVDFGDMVVDNWSSEDTEIQVTPVAEPTEGANMLDSHMYSIVRNFSSSGEQPIKVTVKNAVSSQFRHHVIMVEDRVSGLEVTSNTSWLVDIQVPIKMSASVETGTDVVFEWDFHDAYGKTTVESNGTFSEALHYFGLPGEYNVTVRATNDIQSSPVEVSYKYTFSVLEAIYGLDLRVQDQSRNAALLSEGGGVWQTSPVVFRASCWGSEVSFQFDFDDGTRIERKGTGSWSQGFSASVAHRFLEEGEYSVSVTAINLLKNVTTELGEPFLVQIPPTEVHFEKNFHAYRFGEVTYLSVQLDFGSQVAFNWSMGDQTDYINAPSEIQHVYHSVGTFTVTVVAFNKVHYSQTSCLVAIQNPLQGVELVTSNLLVATKSEIHLEARTVGDYGHWFDWDVGDNRNVRQTSKPTFSYSYREAGIYFVTVVTGNHVSNATSSPLQLIIEASISRLEIHVEDDASLIGTITVLAAQTYSGSDVRYIWDFGDGTPELNTHQAVVNHNYNSTGVYHVRVSGYNQVSNKSATTRIFVLEQMCHPPSLELFGVENHLFRQSEDIRLEAEVKIDCEVTNMAAYKWTLNGSHNVLGVPLQGRFNYLERRTMFIPRRTLQVGTYLVSLEVQMNGTIVFNTITTVLEVIHSDLVSVIEGGTLRFVHKDDRIVMMGGLSYDPDDPTSTLTYTWSCLQIESDRPCFNPPGLTNTSELLPMHNETISFPVRWLLYDKADYFVFTLEVSKPGRTPVETYQVVRVYQETAAVGLSVDCPECEGGVVNSNNLLTLESMCLTCDSNTTYEWKLYYIQDGNTGQHPSGSRCVQAQRSSSGTMPSQGSIGAAEESNVNSPPAPNSETEVLDGHGTTSSSRLGTTASIGQVAGTVTAASTSNISTPFVSGTVTTGGETAISGTSDEITNIGSDIGGAESSYNSFFENYGSSDVDENNEWIDRNGNSYYEEYSLDGPTDDVTSEPSERAMAVSEPSSHSTATAPSPQTDASPTQPASSQERASSSTTSQFTTVVADEMEDGAASYDEYYSFEEFPASSETNPGEEEEEAGEEISDINTTATVTSTSTKSPEPSDESARRSPSMAGNFYESFSHEENTYEYVGSDSYQESQSRETDNTTSKPVVTISNLTETPDENSASGDSLAEGVASSSNQEYGTNYGSTYLEDQYSDYPEEYIDDDGTSPDDDIDESLDDDYSNGDGENSAPADEVADDSQTPQFGRHLISKDKVEVPLSQDQTLTGLSASSLTVRDGVLQEGRTYAVGLKVSNQDGGDTREGMVYQYFQVNEAPKWGTCKILPEWGRELETFFTTNCQEWQDEDSPLRFEIRYSLNESGPDTVLYFGMNYAVKFLLPAGYQANDYNVYLKLSIVDSKGGKTDVCDIAIMVEPNYQVRGHHQDDGPESVESYLYLLTVAPNNDLSVLLDQGDSCSAHAFIRIVTHVLNELEDHEGTSVVHCDHYYHRCKIRRILIDALSQLPIRDGLEAQQTSQALAAVLDVTTEVSERTLQIASKHLLQLVNFCSSQVPERELDFAVFTSTVSSIAAVYDSLEKHFHDQVHADHELSCKESTYATLNAESKIINLFTSVKLKNTSPLRYSTPLIDVVADQVTRLDGLTLTTKDVDIAFPNGFESFLKNITDDVLADGGVGSCFNVGLSGYHMNPLHWGHGANKVTTGIASAHVYSCRSGDPYDVKSLPKDQEVTVKIMNFCSEDKVSCNFTFDPNYMNAHQFNMTEEHVGQDLHILLTLRQGRKQTYPVNILLRYNASPYPDEYDAIWVYTEENNVMDIFLPAGSLNETGPYYLGLVDGELGEPVYRESTDSIQFYSLTMWWGQCLSWSFEKDTWTNEGCIVVPSQNHFVTECKCDHLGIHGVSFFPIATHLTKTEVSLLLVNPHNPIVYSVYGVILGVYLVLFLYCYLTDRHDYDKPGLIFLKDNHPMDKQYYEVSFETGSRPGAGTTARVSLVIRGKEGHSETKELISDQKPLFERNSRDRFIISVPEALGSITSLLIWHDNGGISPGWYLSRVCVRDLISGRKWFFICEQWFAVEEDDGQIEREIKVVKSGIGFQKAFFAKGAQYFSDYYIWSSVFTRPPYSVFTRVQRLTCCYAICMGFMCVNTLWYQTVNDRALNLSIIDISGESILIGIMTALVAIPINFPIIMLFRRAKPLRMPGEIGELYKYIGMSQDYEKEAEAAMNNIPSEARWDTQLIDQTAETLRNLQNWAREKWKQKPKNVVIKELRDDYILAEEVTEETSFSSGFEDYSSPSRSPSDADVLKSQGKGQRSKPEHKKLHRPKIWLPRACYFIAWAGCIVVIVISSVVTLGLGHLFSYRKAVFWMQAFYFSFMQCFFVTQPFVMAMITVAKAWRHRNNMKLFDHYDDNTDLLDPMEVAKGRWQSSELEIQNGIEARQRARYLRFARPPQSDELEKAKEKMQKEKNMVAILWDIILFSTVAFCLMLIAYGKEMHLHYPINNGIVDKFVRTPHPFTDVRTVSDLWYWVENDLLNELFVDDWNNNQLMNETVQSESVILGKISLRQVRVDPGHCTLSSAVRGHFDSCEPPYNRASQSRKPFGPGKIWHHQTKQELNRYSKWGMLSSYEGDGYNVELNKTRAGASDQLMFLRERGWIDDFTRVVIIEFTMYNAPANIFSSVALLAEMPGTGAVYPFPKIESVLVYRYQTGYDYFIMACEFVFLLMTAVSGKQEVQRAVKLKSRYLRDIWAWLEIGKVVLSLTYFAMYVYRFAHVTEITRRLRATYMEEFVDMSFLAYWDQCVRDLIGWLVFIVSFKFLHLFRFNKMVAKFGAVIDATIREILGFLVSYLLLEAAFACLGCLLFGVHYYPMKHAFLAVEVVTILMLGGVPDYAGLQSTFPLLWPAYHILYLVVFVILFGGLMKAVLCRSYRKVKETCKVEPVGGYEVFVFIWQHLLHQCGIQKQVEEEKPFKLPLEFNLAEMEYQVEELLFRMETVCDTFGVSKDGGKDRDSDDTRDGRDDGISTCSAEENLCESYDEKFEEQFFNPEIRDYLQLNRESDDEEEQNFRDKLTMEIFHRLQQDQMKDSGQETLSPSNPMDEDSTAPRDQPDERIPSASRVVKSNGQIVFPKPVGNIGSLEEQTFEKWQRVTWSGSSSQLSTISSLEPYSSGLSSRSNLTPDILLEPPCAGLDYLEQCQLEVKVRSAWRSPGDPNDIVRDSEEGRRVQSNLSMDSFPLPNMLDQVDDSSSSYSDCESKRGKSSSNRRLRKTKTRGKGRSRISHEEEDNLTEEDRAEDQIPVISLGPERWKSGGDSL